MSSAKKPIVVLPPTRAVHEKRVPNAGNPRISVPAQSIWQSSEIASINPLIGPPAHDSVIPTIRGLQENVAGESAVGLKRVTQDSLTEPIAKVARVSDMGDNSMKTSAIEAVVDR